MARAQIEESGIQTATTEESEARFVRTLAQIRARNQVLQPDFMTRPSREARMLSFPMRFKATFWIKASLNDGGGSGYKRLLG